MDSENRLQGYASNSSDVQFWTARAEHHRRVSSGEIDPEEGTSSLWQSFYRTFGAKRLDLNALEEEYYQKLKLKHSEDPQPSTTTADSH